MKKNSSVEEVLKKLNEYFGEAHANFSVYQYGCRIAVDVKYWDFKPERQVRRDIENLGESIDIAFMERMISERALYKSMKNLISNDTEVYFADGDCMRRTTLYDIISSNANGMEFETADL